MVLFLPLHGGLGPEAALEDSGLPLWGPGVEVVQLLGSQAATREASAAKINNFN